ncbi:MAG: VTT domain-containing protein [Acidobacteriota bacterium]
MDWRRLRNDPAVRLIARLVALAALVAIAAAALRITGHGEAFHREWIERHVVGHGLAGRLVFAGLTAVLTAAGFPRHLPAFAAGFAFGVVEGSLLVTLGTGLGAALATLYARLLGRSVLPRRLRDRLRWIERRLAADPFGVALMLRIFPVGSNLATNLLAGVLRVPLRPFLVGSLIGFLPQNAIFALMGSGLRVDPVLRIGLSFVLLLVSALLGRRLYRRMRLVQDESAPVGREPADDDPSRLVSRTS